MFFNQLSKPESLVEFAHRNQAGVGSDAGALEIDLERGVKRELEGLILCFTHWVPTSGAPSSYSDPHKY